MQFIARDNLYTIVLTDTNYNLKYFLGLLNSKVLNYFYQSLNPEKGEALARVKKQHIIRLSIYPIDFSNYIEKSKHDNIVKLVTNLLDLNMKKNTLISSLKRNKVEEEIEVTTEKIDELVYKLYGISENEKKIIDEGV